MGAFRVKICEIDEISVFKCTPGLRQDSASAELESARSRFRRIVPADLIPTKHLAAGTAAWNQSHEANGSNAC